MNQAPKVHTHIFIHAKLLFIDVKRWAKRDYSLNKIFINIIIDDEKIEINIFEGKFNFATVMNFNNK
jgi:hypothetical protein